MTEDPFLRPGERLVMIVGNYGSGKTEVALHLALDLARRGRSVALADLDLVNPYFRSREARHLLEARGVRVVLPPPALEQADLPILVPEIYGLLDPPPENVAILDVGGDDVGARVLSSLRCAIGARPYQLWQVLNARRPFTDTVAGCLAMRQAIEGACRLGVTGFVGNTHLLELTTPDVVLEGWTLARDVARAAALPLRLVTVPERIADAPELAAIAAPLLRLGRILTPPWLAAPAPRLPIPAPREGGALGPHRG